MSGENERPGGWVNGIGWVAPSFDLRQGDRYLTVYARTEREVDDATFVVNERMRQRGDLPLPLLVVRWADGTRPSGETRPPRTLYQQAQAEMADVMRPHEHWGLRADCDICQAATAEGDEPANDAPKPAHQFRPEPGDSACCAICHRTVTVWCEGYATDFEPVPPTPAEPAWCFCGGALTGHPYGEKDCVAHVSAPTPAEPLSYGGACRVSDGWSSAACAKGTVGCVVAHLPDAAADGETEQAE